MRKQRSDENTRTWLRLLLTVVVSVACVLLSLPTSYSQNSSTLKGKSRTVLAIPDTFVDVGPVALKQDSDHDGMPDETEAQNGTNPNDPSDADGDADGDGLTNGDEVAGGSSINNADSDGDGVSDGEEIRLGYNPSDPSNTPPVGVTLIAIQVTPNPGALVINSLLGQQPVQLTVTGFLSDATTVDLTNAANTVYESLDPTVALVDSLGSVGGISTGIATINVVNGARSAQATINVVSFAPSLMSFIHLGGAANNVDVSGDFAYVAVGTLGIQIVDVSDRRAPHIVSTLDTAGTANDIRVVGNLAYVADGSAGLQIIDISNPAFRVTNNGFAFDWGPAMSGDGVTIAFASNDGLFIVNTDGSDQKLLSEDDWDPNFRPEVIPVLDPGTTITGRVVDSAAQPVSNATVKVFGQTVGTSGADGTFSIPGVSTLKGNITVIASAIGVERVDSGFSTAVAPVPNGFTEIGDVDCSKGHVCQRP